MITADFAVKHLVVGGGVVGLAVAANLSRYGSTLLVERNQRYGEETSARNSEVVHAGIYYPSGSLKTQLCIEGRQRLYRFCHERGIAHKKVGKWIVATCDDEVEYLHTLHAKCAALGVPSQFVGDAERAAGEPNVACVAALASPETGIVDSHGLMDGLAAVLAENGGDLALATNVTSIQRAEGGFRVETASVPPEGGFYAQPGR